ncbi:MAG: NADH-quinone oxidoreductase subunit J [Nitrospinota bacterium]
MEGFLFYLLAGAAALAAMLVIAVPNSLYSALLLVVTFGCLAGIYLTLGAEFIAAMQVILYAGAIMVLFLFVIMLLHLGREPRAPFRLLGQKVMGTAVAALLFGALSSALAAGVALGPRGPFSPERVKALGNTQAVGRLLLTDFLLPFEATAVLLFVAIVGAVVLARRRL